MKRFFARSLLMLSCLSALSVGMLQATGNIWYQACREECLFIWIECRNWSMDPNRMCTFELQLCNDFCDRNGIP